MLPHFDVKFQEGLASAVLIPDIRERQVIGPGGVRQTHILVPFDVTLVSSQQRARKWLPLVRVPEYVKRDEELLAKLFQKRFAGDSFSSIEELDITANDLKEIE
ncbi:MAG: hypothetical protein HY648_06940 [Acidobacteria bacterium]|nr:hypothetical protein [Acidobacteriota bacterium]